MKKDTNPNGQLFKMTRGIAKDPIVQFSRLGLNDIPEISKFLFSAWSEGYGPMGSPEFSEDYLQWILGGPNNTRNLLFGGRMNGELVAYQSFLYRTVYYSGKRYNAFLNTHLAVSTKIDLRPKLETAFQMSEQYLLCDARSRYYDPNCDMVLAFIEAEKPLKYEGDKILKKFLGITRHNYMTFNQFMVVPRRLKGYLKQNNIDEGPFLVRPAEENDSTELTKLFNEIPDDIHFARIMTEEELSHHFFGDRNHRTFVAEMEGKIKAFINYFPVRIVKGGQFSSYIIVEYLSSKEKNLPLMAILLNEALKLAEEIGAKSVVLENATYLQLEQFQKIGLMPTFRKMTLSLITKNHQVDYWGGFRIDIK